MRRPIDFLFFKNVLVNWDVFTSMLCLNKDALTIPQYLPKYAELNLHLDLQGGKPIPTGVIFQYFVPYESPNFDINILTLHTATMEAHLFSFIQAKISSYNLHS